MAFHSSQSLPVLSQTSRGLKKPNTLTLGTFKYLHAEFMSKNLKCLQCKSCTQPTFLPVPNCSEYKIPSFKQMQLLCTKPPEPWLPLEASYGSSQVSEHQSTRRDASPAIGPLWLTQPDPTSASKQNESSGLAHLRCWRRQEPLTVPSSYQV